MSNFTAENRIQMVLRYLNGNESIKGISQQVQINKSVLSGWIRLYEQHGSEAFLKNYTRYSTEFKMDEINYMNETGTSSIDTAAIFKISSPGIIRNWQTKWNQGLKLKKKGRPSIKKETKKSESKKAAPTSVEGTVEAVQTKIESIEMENAYLKKLYT